MSSGVAQLTKNLTEIIRDPTPVLEAMASAVLEDITRVAIDGQNTVKGGPMKRNKPSTVKAKQRKGSSPPDHPLWDSQTMRRKDSWIIRKQGKRVLLEPGREIQDRAIYVQQKGYNFFGVSKTGEKAAGEAGRIVLDEMLRKGV